MLYIVATPIGNLSDMSLRAIEALKASQVVACEDTRRTRVLLDHYQVQHVKMVSYREHKEDSAGAHLLNLLKAGETVSLCSDGGFPGISDPGYRLIRLAIENGIKFEVIPGASAVPVALLLSGLPTSSYTFKGFAPRKGGPATRFFDMEKDLPHTLVVFESPFRVVHTLRAAWRALGDRQAAVCIELTKKFERVSRGFLSDLATEFTDMRIKGEVTLVISGNHPKFARESVVPPPAEESGAEEEEDELHDGREGTGDVG
jgi:16S rRNA (cytidine1402-2'-O)-methyltransferase